MTWFWPYIENKTAWPFPKDIMYWEEWPVRHPSLLFAGLRYEDAHYLDNWKHLEADPETFEVKRNLPLRHPLSRLTTFLLTPVDSSESTRSLQFLL